ncbi:MAG: UDP-N-acetylglucosamine--N-acetylmuramyl-(pentapeptide) pyrophosphoryl-undecaprenol N-acetylglucosamine transferase [Sedimentisphaerales bacterium]|nr:UDP-N-acetylglucosamine--N-acetylmuramyl-(pentapeptide) pyrophosphoryl-undecaprenol N-acetylglucosamine transferase [Sedimentisphaerales bacterium]
MTVDDKTHPSRTYVFAGGGTGGHIYPALAVAEQIKRIDPEATILFLCSDRAIDSRILSQTPYSFIPLYAKGLSVRPDRLIAFLISQWKSSRQAQDILQSQTGRTVVTSVGGFASAPAVLAARRLALPVAMLNVDIVPGRANTLLSRFAQHIFVQFQETKEHFGKYADRVQITGCPLRSAFAHPNRNKAISELNLDPNKKMLLITGASSGSASINQAIITLLPKLAEFVASWQIVHLTGTRNYEQVRQAYQNAQIQHKVIDYYDDMPNLYAATDLLIGRSGAVSIAEYAAAGVPAICLPYPYHKDRHQYLNADQLVRVGAAVLVDDRVNDPQQTATELYEQLNLIMANDTKREKMAQVTRTAARLDAAERIATQLVQL